MKILLTGGNGQVGWEIAQRAPSLGYEVLAPERATLDITDANAVMLALEQSAAAVVINAAAYTAVDQAEQQAELAYAVNREGAGHLASACARLSIPLLHISSDYVFAGTQRGGYREEDPVAPLGVYGLSKWQGEEAVRHTLKTHLILRVSWVFGPHGHNFVKTILRLAREKDLLRVVADQHGCPTYAGDIAAVLLTLVRSIATGQELQWGTYHYCGFPATTWHGFAQAIVEAARVHEPLRVQEVVPITTAEYPTLAKRPANSVLDCIKFTSHFGIPRRPWRQGLEKTLLALRA
jgi:dTDP-4-dehydrorhamnose reductase